MVSLMQVTQVDLYGIVLCIVEACQFCTISEVAGQPAFDCVWASSSIILHKCVHGSAQQQLPAYCHECQQLSNKHIFSVALRVKAAFMLRDVLGYPTEVPTPWEI
jgi:hypothetical protein